MNKWKSCLMDEMLRELAVSRQSIAQQSSTISDIIDKSNNILLQLESSRGNTNSNNSSNNSITQKNYSFKKETVQTLAKIVENAPQLFSANMQTLAAGLSQNSGQFEEYLEHSHQHAEYLGSGVRKLVAIGDTMSQIKAVIQEEMEAEDSSDQGHSPSSE
ncbi:PREDICTED: uncharacterized protein LOC108367132 [Rhagoletis zephyria]|uniref:uncharacterized protein LOC108367132 n=1 Tax=Rhagoletis zephyria TaxID=28612 RepID=UPI000811715A|nr:PREDICTED: uncharacterized protein LOC108367132 [Rhagoletis zephyria]